MPSSERSSGSRLVETAEYVHDHARRAKAALQGVAFLERLLDRHAARRPRRPALLWCVISAPCACTASVRQERPDLPSMSTVQQPQMPCSQPTCVPVNRKLVAQEIGQQHAHADDCVRPRSPLTVSDTSSVGSSDVCANCRCRLPARHRPILSRARVAAFAAIRRTKVATARRR